MRIPRTTRDAPARNREALARCSPTRENPKNGLDYVVTISGRVKANGWSDPLQITTKYVPDELILSPSIFHDYLETMAGLEWQSLEELGATLAGDVDSELLLRWVRVRLAATEQGQEHGVDIEQTKSGWDNRMLLARLRFD